MKIKVSQKSQRPQKVFKEHHERVNEVKAQRPQKFFKEHHEWVNKVKSQRPQKNLQGASRAGQRS